MASAFQYRITLKGIIDSLTKSVIRNRLLHGVSGDANVKDVRSGDMFARKAVELLKNG